MYIYILNVKLLVKIEMQNGWTQKHNKIVIFFCYAINLCKFFQILIN